MDLTFTVAALDPLVIRCSGNETFQAYHAGISSDRYPDQARLLVVCMIEEHVSRFSAGTYHRRFRGPLSVSQSWTAGSSNADLFKSIQGSVRNQISASFPQDDQHNVPDIFEGLAEPLAPPSEIQLQKAIKYVFGERQMGWKIAVLGGQPQIVSCYKFEKARLDHSSEIEAERARAAVVYIIDSLVSTGHDVIYAAVAAGAFHKNTLRELISDLWAADPYLFWWLEMKGRWKCPELDDGPQRSTAPIGRTNSVDQSSQYALT